MRNRHRRLRAALVVTGGAVVLLSVGAPGAVADDSYSATVTQTATQTMSYTATVTRDVSSTATWGAPAITRTVTTTLSATVTKTSTQTASDTETATGSTPDDATSNATSQAAFWASLQAQISANTDASIQANTAASMQLAAQVSDTQTDLYNQALDQAKAAVVARDGQPTDTTPDACGSAVFKSDETRWTCTFSDNFDGTSLDKTKWTAWNGVNHFGGTTDCFYSDRSHVSVSGGVLTLTTTRASKNARCTTPDGVVTPQYAAGVVNSKGKFNQTYGMFEARIKFAGGTGIHDNFWLFPEDTSPGDHAEIDVAEPFGSMPNTMFSNTHLVEPSAPGDELGSMRSCALANWASGYHTYAVQWTPTELTFLYDDRVCAVQTWPQLSGQPSAAPFNRNFFMILETLADDGSSSPAPDASTRFPARMSVDWVRVWK